MTIHAVRNTSLVRIADSVPLSADFVSDIIDFKEMNSGTIQLVIDGADVHDGVFTLKQSILCEPNTFAKYPDGTLEMDAGCPNLAANIESIPFRFMLVEYTRGTTTTGTVSIYARAKL